MTATEELKKAIELVERAADILQKSQMAFDFNVGTPHHVAYTRTNASGTVSNVQAKGAPKVEIKRVSSNEQNVSQRHVSYDVHVDGQYHSTHNDINDAMDSKERLESSHDHDTASQEKIKGTKTLIDGVHKVGNDLLNNPMLAEHHGNITRKLEGLKNTPTAKAAAQVAGDLKLIAEKAKPATTTMTEADAGTHLKNVANANDIRMYHKAAKLHKVE